MKFVKLILALSALLIAPATAMDNTSLPAKFPLYWANNAGASFVRNIPVNSQIGISTGAASLADGFPPVTFTPIASGGVPPDGRDFNGILRQVTQALRWAQAGGMYTYDSSFSSTVGGYPKGAMLRSAVLNGRVWMSTVDNNTTDPDSQSAANWVPQPGTPRAGDPVPSFNTTPPPNTVPADGRFVGNALSNATSRANADTYWLFVNLWNNCSYCIMRNSSGVQVFARGPNANSDWNANNSLQVPEMTGATLVGSATIGSISTSNLSGVPVLFGNNNVAMAKLGENLHTLSIAEMPSHFHTAGINDPGHSHQYTVNVTQLNATGGGNLPLQSTQAAGTTGTSLTGVRLTSANGLDTTSSTGGGGAANNVPLGFTVTWNFAL